MLIKSQSRIGQAQEDSKEEKKNERIETRWSCLLIGKKETQPLHLICSNSSTTLAKFIEFDPLSRI